MAKKKLRATEVKIKKQVLDSWTIGGTDANKLVEGEWRKLYEIKKGIIEPDDLSEVFPVQLGIYTEKFNREWFEKQTGLTVKEMPTMMSKDVPFARANLDGITSDDAVFEAKHVSPFTIKDVTNKYYPQVQHYMMVTGLASAYLCCIVGNSMQKIFQIERDDDFIAKLLYAETYFVSMLKADITPPDYIDFDSIDTNTKIEGDVELPTIEWFPPTQH